MIKNVIRLTRLIIPVLFLLATPVLADGIDVPLGVGAIDPTINNPYPKTPIYIPSASLDGHTFYINGGHADFVVQLLDEDDNVVYQTVMPSDVSSIVLPSTLSGTYQIQLLWGDWMFYGWINL